MQPVDGVGDAIRAGGRFIRPIQTGRVQNYSLLAFQDFHAFLRHQVSEHHEAASPRIGDTCETVRLEWVDPLAQASELPPTEMQALPDGADEKAKLYHQVFAAVVQEWWPR